MCKQWMVRYMNLHDAYLTRASGACRTPALVSVLKPALIGLGGERIDKRIEQDEQGFQVARVAQVDQIVQIGHVGLVMLAVVVFQSLGRDMRHQGVFGVWQGWQCMFHGLSFGVGGSKEFCKLQL